MKARYLDFKNTDSGAGLYVEMSETKVKFTATDGAEAIEVTLNISEAQELAEFLQKVVKKHMRP